MQDDANRDVQVRYGLRERRGLPPVLDWIGPRGLRALYLGLEPLMHPGAPSSISVVVPAWNSENSLPACVAGLARAAAAVRSHCDIEIIVVDDGSARPVTDVLEAGRAAAELRVLRVVHGGQSRATNTGVLRARGDILVLCDSDMVLNPWSLDQLLRMLSRYRQALCFGFREHLAPDDARLHQEFLTRGRGLDDLLCLRDENRFRFHVPGFPSSLFACTRQLEDLIGSRRVLPPGPESWPLPRMAYGCLMACRRQEFLEIGGFDGRFVRWGYADTELAARWIARGGILAPVFTANGLHVWHKPRHPLQWRLAGRSRQMYESILSEGWRRSEVVTSQIVADRLVRGPAGRAEAPPVPPRLTGTDVARKAAMLGDLDLFESALGRHVRDAVRDPVLAAHALRALRLSGVPGYLECASLLTDQPPPEAALEHGLLSLAIGNAERAPAFFATAARHGDWWSRASASQLLYRPAVAHWRSAVRHLQQAMPRAAASGLLACLGAPSAERYRRRCEEALATVPREDRRFY